MRLFSRLLRPISRGRRQAAVVRPGALLLLCVHFYVLGIAAAAVHTKWGLAATYLIWLLLLVLMRWPCAWYYRMKRDQPNWVTRYF